MLPSRSLRSIHQGVYNTHAASCKSWLAHSLGCAGRAVDVQDGVHNEIGMACQEVDAFECFDRTGMQGRNQQQVGLKIAHPCLPQGRVDAVRDNGNGIASRNCRSIETKINLSAPGAQRLHNTRELLERPTPLDNTISTGGAAFAKGAVFSTVKA